LTEYRCAFIGLDSYNENKGIQYYEIIDKSKAFANFYARLGKNYLLVFWSLPRRWTDSPTLFWGFQALFSLEL